MIRRPDDSSIRTTRPPYDAISQAVPNDGAEGGGRAGAFKEDLTRLTNKEAEVEIEKELKKEEELKKKDEELKKKQEDLRLSLLHLKSLEQQRGAAHADKAADEIEKARAADEIEKARSEKSRLDKEQSEVDRLSREDVKSLRNS